MGGPGGERETREGDQGGERPVGGPGGERERPVGARAGRDQGGPGGERETCGGLGWERPGARSVAQKAASPPLS